MPEAGEGVKYIIPIRDGHRYKDRSKQESETEGVSDRGCQIASDDTALAAFLYTGLKIAVSIAIGAATRQ